MSDRKDENKKAQNNTDQTKNQLPQNSRTPVPDYDRSVQVSRNQPKEHEEKQSGLSNSSIPMNEEDTLGIP